MNMGDSMWNSSGRYGSCVDKWKKAIFEGMA